ncbi:MAG: PorT family protein [Chitinophagales bacterium]|nr:PorT family protein [Chitinophagales bacterium]
MHSFNFRHQLHLHRKKILIAGLFFFSSFHLAHAQYNITLHDERYNNRNFHFGISLGLDFSNYKVTMDSAFTAQNEILVVKPNTDPGLSLGILSDLHLSKSFELRFIPTLTFTDRALQYTLSTADTLGLKKIESVYLEFPLQIKYRSKPYKDVRMYVLGGMNYSIDMQSNAAARQAENLVKVYRGNLSAEYGIGIEFHLPLVIISPEIKGSYGLFNILKPDPNLNAARVLNGLRARTLIFTIHFEG